MFDDRDLERLEHVFDGRYRKIEDCEELTSNLDKRMDEFAVNQCNTNTKLAIMNTKMSATIGILAAIAAPLIPICIQKLFGG